MSSTRHFPRNEQSRRDAVAGHRFHGPDNAQSRAALFAADAVSPYNSAGCLSVQSAATVYEGTLASTGWTLGVRLTNAEDTFQTLNIASEAAAGVSSFGLAPLVGSIELTNSQLVTFGIGPDATYVASAQADITLTIARSGFNNRSISSEAVRLLTIQPFSLSYTGPSSLAASLWTGTDGIVAQPVFTLQNSAESFHAGLTATAAGSLFTGLPVSVASTFFNAARTTLTVTFVGSTTVTGDKIKPTFAVTSSFVLRKAAFVTSTLCVIA